MCWTGARLFSGRQTVNGSTRKTRRARGQSTLIVVIIVALVAVVGAMAFFLGTGSASRDGDRSGDLYTARLGTFDITVPSSGELAALNSVEIRNKLEVRATITWIIEEGTTAKAGDVLIRLADEDILNRIKDAEDAAKNAEAAQITAQANLDIRLSSSQSEEDRADLTLMLAELALRAWEEGAVVSTRQDLALGLEIADINYQRLVDRYTESKRLVEQQFISTDEFKRDEIAMIEAKARLDQAKLDIEVYENYQYKQDKAQKESDVDQAKAERERVKDRHKAELQTVRAEAASKKHQLESRRERLADLQEQLEYCVVTAPSGGLVVYSSSLEQNRWSRGNRGDLQVGAELHKNELVIVLPDTDQMTANVKVNEALSGLIEPGQQAIVTLDAIPEAVLEGEVISIGVLAESGGWRDPNRRDYTVKIQLTNGADLGLKPAMRCKADIYVDQVEDALFIPIQAAFRTGGTTYVYVRDGSQFSERKVTLGRSSELFVEVLDGLSENDSVLLRKPRTEEVASRLKAEKPGDRERPGRRRGPARAGYSAP